MFRLFRTLMWGARCKWNLPKVLKTNRISQLTLLTTVIGDFHRAFFACVRMQIEGY